MLNSDCTALSKDPESSALPSLPREHSPLEQGGAVSV